MHCKIFYSWQSDLPNKTNRGFIGDALDAAAKSIHNDDSIEVEPVIDRDTINVPGSPDIANTIFSKIENAQVFVCDISIINLNTPSRPTPNPNVLLELGYAIKTLGWENVIMVMNTAFGKPEVLPFDLRMRRVITYNMPEISDDRATERKKLQKTLDIAIRTILEGLEVQTPGEFIKQPSIVEQTINAIENSQPNQAFLVRQFMTSLRDQLDALNPDFSRNDIHHDELLIQSIEQTKELIIDFARVVEVIAAMNNFDAALKLYKSFDLMLERYNLPLYFSGSFREYDFDFYIFITHELFVTFLSFFIREERWDIIGLILDDNIYVNHNPTNRYGYSDNLVPFTYISQVARLLEHHKNRLRLNRISIHADILNERHTQGELARIVPIQQFIDADCFLFLRYEFQDKKADEWHNWIPWTKIYMTEVPRYLLEADSIRYAEKLLPSLGVKEIHTFRIRFNDVSNNFAKMFSNGWPSSPLSRVNPLTIGSK
ncbi:hypothetical protein ACSQ6I_20720 [Anabaena sp. WFMT]|uniref:hypothetical protein n=1 Tax=Anabaena sp. WFMT TaxID=3449730 RepID=UPI003F24FA6C